MKKENVAIIGSTGSVGEQTLEVFETVGDKNIYALAVNNNIEKLIKQIIKYRPRVVCVYDENRKNELEKILYNKKIRVKLLCGKDGLYEIANDKSVDFVVNAMACCGIRGINESIEFTKMAIKNHKKIAISNKETIVCGGKKLFKFAKKFGVELRPIDSEHSAIWQCLSGENKNRVKRLILTCSGGPFFGKEKKDLKKVKVSDCLKHPNWKMGKKITIDSATLVNKGLEVIEAHYLFDMKPQNIDVVIQRESIIHSMVEFMDGSVKAQLGCPSMKVPISYAIYKELRPELNIESLDFNVIEKISFNRVDNKTFEAIDLAYRAIEKGDEWTKKYCMADEIQVMKFINGEIKFLDIVKNIKKELYGSK